MPDDRVFSKINAIDKINSSLRGIILKLYGKATSDELDGDTMAFLIYIAELLENLQIDLKDVNIEMIKDFIPSSAKERSRFLCQTLSERDEMQKSQEKLRLDTIKLLQEKDAIIPTRH